MDHHAAAHGTYSGRVYYRLPESPLTCDLPAVDPALGHVLVEVCPDTKLRGPVKAFWTCDLNGDLADAVPDLIMTTQHVAIHDHTIIRAERWVLSGPEGTILRATRFANYEPQHRGWPEGI